MEAVYHHWYTRDKMTLKCLEMAEGGRGDTEGCPVRPHAASCGLESESLFESLSCETRLIPEEYEGCDQSYSGSLLRRLPHRLAWSGNDNSRRSILDGSGSAIAATARPLMRTRRLR